MSIKLIKNLITDFSIKKFFFPEIPNFATINEWNEWHVKNRNIKPIRYFLFFDLKVFVRRNIYYKINNLYSKFRLRYIQKFNQINIKTLKYEYYDIDIRLVHGMFALLLEFVEKEKAIMYKFSIDSNKERKKELKKLSNLECGIKYLEWETTLDQDPNSQDYSPEQARAAKEILHLLNYWLDKKNNVHSNKSIINYNKLNTFSTLSSFHIRKLDIIQNDYHEKLDDEEEEMLIRLIKIRKHLWT